LCSLILDRAPRKTWSQPARYGFGWMRLSLIDIHQLRMTYSPLVAQAGRLAATAAVFG